MTQTNYLKQSMNLENEVKDNGHMTDLRVLEFLTALKTYRWLLAVVFFLVELLSIWHISHFLSQFYKLCYIRY